MIRLISENKDENLNERFYSFLFFGNKYEMDRDDEAMLIEYACGVVQIDVFGDDKQVRIMFDVRNRKIIECEEMEVE